MFALPPNLREPGQHLTGLSCPECPGVLEVRTEGSKGYLQFTCRVGHTFSVADLLHGKERRLEESLWAAVIGFEELARLLADLDTHTTAHDGSASGRYRQRRERALTNARAIRDLLDGDRAVALMADAPSSDGEPEARV